MTYQYSGCLWGLRKQPHTTIHVVGLLERGTADSKNEQNGLWRWHTKCEPRNKCLLKKSILCPTWRHTAFSKDIGGGGAEVPGGATPTPTERRAWDIQCHLRRGTAGRRRTLPVKWPKGSAPGYGHGPGTERVSWTLEMRCAPSLAPTAGPHLTSQRCSHQEVALKEALGRALESSMPRGGGQGGPRSLGSAVSW